MPFANSILPDISIKHQPLTGHELQYAICKAQPSNSGQQKTIIRILQSHYICTSNSKIIMPIEIIV